VTTLSTCTDCGAVWNLALEACDVCGSGKRSIEVFEACSIGITEEYTLQGRHGEPGKIKPHLKISSRRKFNHDRQQEETVVMVVNSDTDDYQQIWTDDAGKITFQKQGNLVIPICTGGRRTDPLAAR